MISLIDYVAFNAARYERGANGVMFTELGATIDIDGVSIFVCFFLIIGLNIKSLFG